MQLDNSHIVMVETSHSGNIGAAARAMNNMALSRLSLVSPRCRVDEQAYARATGAFELLGNHQKFSGIPDAIADCHLVVGSSARARTLTWPTLTPAELADKVATMGSDQQVAILFGQERTGLTNEQLHHCHYAVNIPTNPNFSSLNVASAVQVICYELFKTLSADAVPPPQPDDKLASALQTEGLFDHLEQVITHTGFLNPAQPKQLMTRLRRLLLRAEPSENEVNILRGILSSVKEFES